jgi:hypothetical protein
LPQALGQRIFIRSFYKLSLELNQEGLVEELKVPFGGIWGGFSRKMDCADREKIKSKSKDLDKGNGKSRVELKIKLANLKVIVYL